MSRVTWSHDSPTPPQAGLARPSAFETRAHSLKGVSFGASSESCANLVSVLTVGLAGRVCRVVSPGLLHRLCTTELS